ncbi:MAG: hypothetical protein AAGA56_08810 [Myxococcota bacterium]
MRRNRNRRRWVYGSVLAAALLGACSEADDVPPPAPTDTTEATGGGGSAPEPPPPIRYEAALLEATFDESRIPDRLAVDYDDDGVVDQVTRSVTEVAITLSGTDTTHTYRLERPNGEVRQITEFDVISLREDRRFPSIVLSEMNWGTDNTPRDLEQHLVLNREGRLTTVALGHRLIGRDVSCRWSEAYDEAQCFYASYGYFTGARLIGQSRLVGLAEDGAVTDRTETFGLPFPVLFDGFGTNGYHLIGAAWLDFNGDGKQDIIAVGQHSETLVVNMAETPADVSWKSPSDDFRRVWTPRDHNLPCAYFTVEQGEASTDSDYLECYDADAQQWYPLDLGVKLSMVYEPVLFWDEDGDASTVEFAARRRDDESYALFQIRGAHAD